MFCFVLGFTGTTALMTASQNGHTAVVRLLLERGARVEQGMAADGSTALLVAATHGHTHGCFERSLFGSGELA